MKRINLLYIAIIPLFYVLFKMNANLGKASAFFYGFAENKETELSHDKDVLVHKILVTPGQTVVKGQLLMEVKQAAIDLKIGTANLDIERLNLEAQQRRQNLLDQIQQLQARRVTKVATLEAEIQNLQATIDYNQSLLKDLKTIDSEEVDTQNSPNHIKLKALKDQLELVVRPIDIEIAQYQKELALISKPTQVQQEKLKTEIDFYKNEQDQLIIRAPSDGIIGNILCKEGENISAFSTLINFYERNPTLVKGFVHESLILQVQEGDSLIVSSTLHPDQKIGGKVIGLGTRIVEIPERLRKIPDVKTYGREIMIEIPHSNPFLQKEKVMLNALEFQDNNYLASLFSIFNQQTKKGERDIESSISINK